MIAIIVLLIIVGIPLLYYFKHWRKRPRPPPPRPPVVETNINDIAAKLESTNQTAPKTYDTNL